MLQQEVLVELEELRESGDYEGLMSRLPGDWRQAPAFEEMAVRARLLAAEVASRANNLEEMEAAVSPYLDGIERMPFGLVPRVLVALSVYKTLGGEPAEGLRLASKAAALASIQGNELALAEAAEAEGRALLELERLGEAIERFRKAVELYGGQSRSYRLAVAEIYIGQVLDRMGQVEEARAVLERAIKLLIKFRDELSLAVAQMSAASALRPLGEYEASLRYLKLALETFEQKGHQAFAMFCLGQMAETLICMKAYDRAQELLSRALEKAIALRSSHVAFVYNLKGRIYLENRQWEQAEKALTAAIEIAEQAGNKLQWAEARRMLGRLYLAQGREEEAMHVLRSALEEARDLQAGLLELETKALLAGASAAYSPMEAARWLSEVEAALKDRSLGDIRRLAQNARRQIESLDREHYFILSDAKMPTLSEAKVAMLKWLWARALQHAQGNTRRAADILAVTPTYIRRLTKLIPRGLIKPGRKKYRRRKKRAQP
jgi:tetratricopeptide (TPR) repeat protein